VVKLARERATALLGAELEIDQAMVASPHRVDWPDTFRFDPPFRASLQNLPPALVSPRQVEAVLAAERALGEPAVAAALASLRELEAFRVEAHEARHALEPEHQPVPPGLHQLADAEADFEESAEAELRAYLGELRDSLAPPCLGVVKLLRNAAGNPQRETPHHFASRLILGELAPGAEPIAAAQALCRLPEAVLRERAGLLYLKLFGRALSPATRRLSPGAASASTPRP
jgi:hypothetical protein